MPDLPLSQVEKNRAHKTYNSHEFMLTHNVMQEPGPGPRSRQPRNPKGRYWIGTVPYELWIDPSPLPSSVLWCRGQQERGQSQSRETENQSSDRPRSSHGNETGYHHVQLVVGFSRQQRLSFVRKLFAGHWEPTISDSADQYVWKEETRIPDTQFEYGAKPMQRNLERDWDAIRESAISGNLTTIPSDIFVRCYGNLKKIASDHLVPHYVEREVFVFWGITGTGKSKRAWDEGGMLAYPKDPCTKWWCGYKDQEVVSLC